jgi:hypothetical protein
VTFLDSPPRQTERRFQAQVIELAEVLGWKIRHDRATNQRRDCRVCHAPFRCAGCSTPLTIVRNDPGLLDLLLTRRPRIIWAEIKTDRGKLTDDQKLMLAELRECGQEAYVFRPKTWEQIVRLLR